MRKIANILFILFIAAFNVFITWRSAEAMIKMSERIKSWITAIFVGPVLIAWAVIVIACWVFWIEVVKSQYEKH